MANSNKSSSTHNITTTDATVTTMTQATVTDNSVLFIKAVLVLRKITGSTGEGKRIELSAVVRRQSAGAATLGGSVANASDGEAALSTASATIDVSSNDFRVRVTGIAAVQIDWDCYVETFTRRASG